MAKSKLGRFTIGALIVLTLSGCVSGGSSGVIGDAGSNPALATSVPSTPEQTVPGTRKTVFFEGSGGLNENTTNQRMSGNYILLWRTVGDCAYYADLNGSEIFSADTATHGRNNIYDLAPGSYHIHMITGPAPDCSWGAGFAPVN